MEWNLIKIKGKFIHFCPLTFADEPRCLEVQNTVVFKITLNFLKTKLANWSWIWNVLIIIDLSTDFEFRSLFVREKVLNLRLKMRTIFAFILILQVISSFPGKFLFKKFLLLVSVFAKNFAQQLKCVKLT